MSLSVLHVLVPEPPGELGGADMHVHDLALAQVAAGMRPVVLERGSSDLADRLRGAGIEVVSATGRSFNAAVRILAREARNRSADIIHAHGYDADYWAAAARFRYPGTFRGRSLIFTQHGVVEDSIWHRCKTLLDAGCTRLADGVIACAPGLVGRMRRWCPYGLVVSIPNGVRAPRLPGREEARTSLGFGAGDVVVAYVGRLSPEKRPDRVLSLVADARSAGLPVSGLMAGSGALRAELERQADKLGIRRSVKFAGLVLDIGWVYAAADVLVLLSDTETTSRVVIEAMLSGVPVLASAVGGVPGLLDGGRAGCLVPPGDRGAASHGLVELLRSPDKFTREARRRADEHYVVDVMGRRVAEFYRTVGVNADR